jgi:hypothetical protein
VTSIIDRANITDVWHRLGGGELRNGRGRAFWRVGDGLNVSVDCERGLWRDFVSGDGGGVLDLIATVRGGTRADAAKWLEAELGGGPKQQERRRIVTCYDYSDADGKLLYQVVRTAPKGFFQRRPDGVGGWVNKKHPNQVLYRLREVSENPIIFVCEGEKDCETLREFGFVATTAAGGANAPWLDSYTDALRGREVILIPDNDAPGRQRVARLARALFGKVARLVVLTLEGDGVKDVSDWFAAGHSELELIAMLDGETVTQ